MNLQEAFEACDNGNFVTHKYFDKNQSMHEYKGQYYYEDGANLTHHIEWMESQDSYKNGWSIKYKIEQVDEKLLNEMHIKNSRMMLQSDTYEKCIVK